MNHVKKIALFLAIIMIEQFCFGSSYGSYKPSSSYGSQTQVQYEKLSPYQPSSYAYPSTQKQTNSGASTGYTLSGAVIPARQQTTQASAQPYNWGPGNKVGDSSPISTQQPYQSQQPALTESPYDWTAAGPGNKLGDGGFTVYLLTDLVGLAQEYQNNIVNQWDLRSWGQVQYKTIALRELTDAITYNKVSPDQAIIIINALLRGNDENLELKVALESVKKDYEGKAGIAPATASQKPQTYLYTRSSDVMSAQEAAEFNAARLIEESYVAPSQQLDIYTLFQRPFVINQKTGAPVFLDENNQPIYLDKNNSPTQDVAKGRLQSMPSIEDILSEIGSSSAHGKALQAALDAINIALKVATLEAGFDATKQNYYWYQNADSKLTTELQKKKARIEAKLAKSSSTSQDYTYKQSVDEITKKLNNQDFIVLSAEQAQAVANDYDFKKLVASDKASKAGIILFQQCFIAQQHHLKDAARISKIQMNPIVLDADGQTVTTYLFNGENITISSLIAIARSIPDKSQKHTLVTHMYQAALTAVDIAERAYPYSILSSRPFVDAMKDYANKIKEYWLNPDFGATKDDVSRQTYADNLAFATKVGTGIAVVGIGAGLAYTGYNNQVGITTGLKDIGSSIYNGFASIPSYIQNGVTAGAKAVVPDAVVKAVTTKEDAVAITTPRVDSSAKALKDAQVAAITDPSKAGAVKAAELTFISEQDRLKQALEADIKYKADELAKLRIKDSTASTPETTAAIKALQDGITKNETQFEKIFDAEKARLEAKATKLDKVYGYKKDDVTKLELDQNKVALDILKAEKGRFDAAAAIAQREIDIKTLQTQLASGNGGTIAKGKLSWHESRAKSEKQDFDAAEKELAKLRAPVVAPVVALVVAKDDDLKKDVNSLLSRFTSPASGPSSDMNMNDFFPVV